ncbi:MAG: peptidoglycan glycosyltransferase [Lachnospiraceae bacterium]|nr:peptidoglycan glycosyltransferase [Lachnospiraceae bacterium]
MLCILALLGLLGRLGYLMIWQSEYYETLAKQLHERERSIKAARGQIIDAGGVVLATNKTVCTVSVIHSQITEPEQVERMLVKELGITEEEAHKKVSKVSAIEKIKSNVSKETGDAIRSYDLDGVKVDEDYKRYYPYGSLASKVLGFTGSDNQGIVGLEVKYEDDLKGEDGTIFTVTDARGVELDEEGENRLEPVAGNDLHISMDYNIQTYATQLASQVMQAKEADYVSILVMNPQNGEMLAMANVPEFDLNAPFTLTEDFLPSAVSDNSVSGNDAAQQKQDALNRMWRNACINDTYEPGSTFKIITAAAALEAGVVRPEDTFSCPGFIIVEDRKIRCHKTAGHGSETFVQGTMNSCNPVFITVGLRLGIDQYYEYFTKFGLKEKTGIDLPGEAGTIMHQKDNMGLVELATVSFGQSFQITPVQLATTVSSIINGGRRITPHFGVSVSDASGKTVKRFAYEVKEGIVSEETSRTMREILEQVVAEGSGKNGAVEGFSVGGKTATSQTLPRGSGKYIASFVGFSPAENPKVLAMVVINNPKGIYYGGQIAAPVIKKLFENILPYLERINYN